jgi:hypothetical protein
VFAFVLNVSTFYGKEWKCLKTYQKETSNSLLSESDWLTFDRTHRTTVWTSANAYNLVHNKPEEYQTIKQRSAFYEWMRQVLKEKGHEVIWPAMAELISNKLQIMQHFPQCLLIRKKVKNYAKLGGGIVFNSSFDNLKTIYNAAALLKNTAALQWDETMLYNEQFIYLETIYKTIDKRSLHQIERIAKGKFLYGIVVPRAIRFEGDISNPKDRYNYGINKLKPYCENRYQ